MPPWVTRSKWQHWHVCLNHIRGNLMLQNLLSDKLKERITTWIQLQHTGKLELKRKRQVIFFKPLLKKKKSYTLTQHDKYRKEFGNLLSSLNRSTWLQKKDNKNKCRTFVGVQIWCNSYKRLVNIAGMTRRKTNLCGKSCTIK